MNETTALLLRDLERGKRHAVYRELLRTASLDNRALGEMLKLTISTLVQEDLELEHHRRKLLKFSAVLSGARDALNGHPWCRFPRDLGWTGRLAGLTGGEAKVYMAVMALVEPRTLVTFARLETIANMAGRSVSRTSKILTSLKKQGLVQRWCKCVNKEADEWLWFTRIVVDFEGADVSALQREPVIPNPPT